MHYIRKEDHEASERLLNQMSENESKTRKSLRQWQVFALLLCVINFTLSPMGLL